MQFRHPYRLQYGVRKFIGINIGFRSSHRHRRRVLEVSFEPYPTIILSDGILARARGSFKGVVFHYCWLFTSPSLSFFRGRFNNTNTNALLFRDHRFPFLPFMCMRAVYLRQNDARRHIYTPLMY